MDYKTESANELNVDINKCTYGDLLDFGIAGHNQLETKETKDIEHQQNSALALKELEYWNQLQQNDKEWSKKLDSMTINFLSKLTEKQAENKEIQAMVEYQADASKIMVKEAKKIRQQLKNAEEQQTRLEREMERLKQLKLQKPLNHRNKNDGLLKIDESALKNLQIGGNLEQGRNFLKQQKEEIDIQIEKAKNLQKKLQVTKQPTLQLGENIQLKEEEKLSDAQDKTRVKKAKKFRKLELQ